MGDWNPDSYLKFEKERTQPVKDLAARIEIEEPSRILDIGCGPGNSTKELKIKWPKAYIIGLDNSPNMIEKAKANLPDIEWVPADASTDLTHLGKFDIVFSNAAIQWIPNHESLLRKLFFMLNAKGVLAIQIPNVSEMAINKALKTTVSNKKWEKYLESAKQQIFYYSPQFYYDILCKLTPVVYLWRTNYYHVMSSHRNIIDWYKSTGMRPYLDELPNDNLRAEFANDVLKIVEKEYEVQKDGNILFPFTRIFFTAYNLK
ncbi:MAG TPA: methyltransferase domain-containing protein [Methylomusa anaerophila]|uniref:Trans-aconitate 2-methyltransferase n=1 Tax=Methylomusa anaerophila TaxID=1930071 RepID=A0A348AF52_9FIRM|nr:methyltransferase domain-containing protein [Methylomusa anaerophila]BBB89700.1 trans-aconitate 2-methyltransferase [Methylomusa anaerophila]HML89256.1 methyltransferase domain-containing protein [Methylomusa anaerophila]